MIRLRNDEEACAVPTVGPVIRAFLPSWRNDAVLYIIDVATRSAERKHDGTSPEVYSKIGAR